MGDAAFLLQSWFENSGPCPVCGIDCVLPANYLKKRREDGKSFYCPNGHSQSYTKSEADRLREQLEAAKRDAEWQRARAERADKSLIAQKAQTTKARNKLERVANGVCPCCTRSFTNLRRHMATKHPDFKGSPE